MDQLRAEDILTIAVGDFKTKYICQRASLKDPRLRNIIIEYMKDIDQCFGTPSQTTIDNMKPDMVIRTSEPFVEVEPTCTNVKVKTDVDEYLLSDIVHGGIMHTLAFGNNMVLSWNENGTTYSSSVSKQPVSDKHAKAKSMMLSIKKTHSMGSFEYGLGLDFPILRHCANVEYI